MRFFTGLIFTLLVTCPTAASGQSFVVQGAGGPTLVDSGHSLAAGIGFSPNSRLTILFDVERTHLSSQVRSTGDSVSTFRGGTLTLGSAELQVSLFGRNRVSPYGLAGFAAGVSRPNVNEQFADPVTNDVRAVFFGGGLHVPVNERVGFFADGRMMIGAEAGELLAVAPIRAGLSLRF